MGLSIYNVIREQLDDVNIRWISEVRLSDETSIFVDCPTLVRFSKGTDINSPVLNSSSIAQVFIDVQECYNLMVADGYTGTFVNMMNKLEIYRFGRAEERFTGERYSTWDTLTFSSKSIIQKNTIDNIMRIDIRLEAFITRVS